MHSAVGWCGRRHVARCVFPCRAPGAKVGQEGVLRRLCAARAPRWSHYRSLLWCWDSHWLHGCTLPALSSRKHFCLSLQDRIVARCCCSCDALPYFFPQFERSRYGVSKTRNVETAVGALGIRLGARQSSLEAWHGVCEGVLLRHGGTAETATHNVDVVSCARRHFDARRSSHVTVPDFDSLVGSC